MRGIQKFKHPRLIVTLASFCLALVIAAGVALPLWLRRSEPLPPIPVYENAPYTAQQIADMVYVGGLNAVPTSTYNTVYVSNSSHLNIGLLPEDEYLDVYQYQAKNLRLDQTGLRNFTDSILPRVAVALGGDIPQYTIKYGDNYGDWLLARQVINGYEISFQQFRNYNCALIRRTYERSSEPSVISGVPVKIDQNMSDEEIIAALSPLKKLLCEIFGVSMPQVYINRRHATDLVTIYFHNESKLLCDFRETPLSDYIEIEFDFEDYGSIPYEEPRVCISYRCYRDGIAERCASINRVKRISLTDAEALLYNGYVFCIHMCPVCTSQREKITFNGYDYVNLEYKFGEDAKTRFQTTGVPFYVFYKKIETTANGHEVYAMAYVPAIEVRDYAAYFEAQTAQHGTR